MAHLSDIKTGVIVEINGEPFRVVDAQTSKISQAKNVMKMRLKSLVTDKVIAKSMQGSDKIDLAEISFSVAQYLYADDVAFYFMDNTSFDQFTLTPSQVGQAKDYLIEGTNVKMVNHNGRAISIELPIKIDLKVVEAPPGIKGDSVQGGTKQVKTETGLMVATPLFIEEGDVIRVNTEDGTYVERAS